MAKDEKKLDLNKNDYCPLTNFGPYDDFYENIYDQMNRIDQYHQDMNRMMNSLRGYYFNNDYLSKYLPSRRPFLGYDFRNNRNNDLCFPNSPFFFKEGYKIAPPIDVLDKEKEIEIKMDVPGLTRDNVQINLCNGNIEISGGYQKVDEQKDDKQRYYIKERTQSSFYRSFPLPENVCEDDIKATFKDGVLKIDIPKKELPAKKKIEIQ